MKNKLLALLLALGVFVGGLGIMDAAQISRLHDDSIQNGDLINADDLNDEFDQLVNESNSQDTRITTQESGTTTIGGVKTFSSNIKVNGIDERSAGSGVTVDSVLLKDGMVTVAGTATTNGQVGYASNLFQGYRNGTLKNFLMAGDGVTAVTPRSSNTILAAADSGTLFVYTSTFTQTLTAAATLGANWYVDIKNDGTGAITLDPNSSETVDGLTTMAVYPGESFRVVCDGSNFKTIGRAKGLIPLSSQSASTSATLDFTTFINSDFEEVAFHVQNLIPATDQSQFRMQVSEDAGSTWKSGASDYQYAIDSVNASATSNISGSTGTTFIGLTVASGSGSSMDNANPLSGWVRVKTPSNASVKKIVTFDGAYVNDAGNIATAEAAGTYKGTTNAITGIRFLMNSGNITSGTITMYGVRK